MTKEESLVLIDLEMRPILESENVENNEVETSYLGLLRIVRRDIEAGNSSYDDFLNNLITAFEETIDGAKNETTAEERKTIILETFEEIRKKYDYTK